MGHIRVLHVLANSHPDTNGYAIRSHMIVKHQNQIEDMEVHAITSPFYPNRQLMQEDIEHDGINYVRCKHPYFIRGRIPFSQRIIRRLTKVNSKKQETEKPQKSLVRRMYDFVYFGFFKLGRLMKKPFQIPYRVWEERVLLKHFESDIFEYVKENNIEIIHAHTPYRVGIPSMNVAKKMGKKFVYEMRGMWEETAVANGRWKRNGPAYSRFRRLENRVLKGADKIVAISMELKRELISRGISGEKIAVVPNGIETVESVVESPKLETIETELNRLDGDITVGYIGSLRKLEGVDMTANAVSELVKQGHNINFFCLTGANGQEELIELSNRIGLKSRALITGPVPHSEVNQYYDLIDIFVVSRPDYPVTRTVTPLKPFEAMARARPVVITNLPALNEIITNLETGIITEDNELSSLVKSIKILISDQELRTKLGEQAKSWVINERSWSNLVRRYSTVYAE